MIIKLPLLAAGGLCLSLTGAFVAHAMRPPVGDRASGKRLAAGGGTERNLGVATGRDVPTAVERDARPEHRVADHPARNRAKRHCRLGQSPVPDHHEAARFRRQRAKKGMMSSGTAWTAKPAKFSGRATCPEPKTARMPMASATRPRLRPLRTASTSGSSIPAGRSAAGIITGKPVWLRDVEADGRAAVQQAVQADCSWAIRSSRWNPATKTTPKREAKDPWNYLRGLDKNTGKTLWVSDDALTHYNTPVMGTTAGRHARRSSGTRRLPRRAGNPDRPVAGQSRARSGGQNARGATRPKAKRCTTCTGTSSTLTGSTRTRRTHRDGHARTAKWIKTSR